MERRSPSEVFTGALLPRAPPPLHPWMVGTFSGAPFTLRSIYGGVAPPPHSPTTRIWIITIARPSEIESQSQVSWVMVKVRVNKDGNAVGRTSILDREQLVVLVRILPARIVLTPPFLETY